MNLKYDLPEPHRSEYPMEDFNQVESYHIDSFVKLMKPI